MGHRRRIIVAAEETAHVLALAMDAQEALGQLAPDSDGHESIRVVVDWLESLHGAVAERARAQVDGQLELTLTTRTE